MRHILSVGDFWLICYSIKNSCPLANTLLIMVLTFGNERIKQQQRRTIVWIIITCLWIHFRGVIIKLGYRNLVVKTHSAEASRLHRTHKIWMSGTYTQLSNIDLKIVKQNTMLSILWKDLNEYLNVSFLKTTFRSIVQHDCMPPQSHRLIKLQICSLCLLCASLNAAKHSTTSSPCPCTAML